MKTLVVIAGEASGDMYGGMLIKEILKFRPDLKIKGIGGDRVRSAGAELICHISETAVMGAVEMVDKLFFFYRKYKQILSIFDEEDILGVVLIDFPDFNLRVAASAKKRNIPVFYYVSPQLWAWRKGRIKSIKANVTEMFVILPFEKRFYKKNGVNVNFLGHPLIDIVKPSNSKAELQKSFNVTDNSPVIGILPGSRKKEVAHHLPEMLKAVVKLKDRYPKSKFLLPIPSLLSKEFVESYLNDEYDYIQIIEGRNYDVMAVADVLISKSGTSTLEAAILGTPMVIIYKASILSFLLAKWLVKIEFIGLPNLLAQKQIVPELIQDEMNENLIVKNVIDLLDNSENRERVINDLKQLRAQLGDSGSSKRIAHIIVNSL